MMVDTKRWSKRGHVNRSKGEEIRAIRRREKFLGSQKERINQPGVTYYSGLSER